ncbi:protein IQ-DOMAIN 14-like [Cynara cardunculus var. scolymus]|uniref:DUF4005 domain-containing protein n=1 Tax=Cynara cardunculus var. scolymus TaxID=59895 RepID=A0A103XG19_CYNCS|nr:protein IQ-DOMAIN 14-like [Cynara cardunculus var. scolymus]KVH90080.1 protein of unknown function DUF4005 [Cynara cardunculus var. scolymus]
MGKASKFFRALFGFKTIEPTDPPPSRSDLNKQPKRHWSFIKSHRDKPTRHHLSNTFDASLSRPFDTPLHHHASIETTGDDDATTGSSNHAIAVAAATAAVAEAAVAAAHAAAEVVRMTSRATGGYGLRGERAAVKIQSYFRSYLARKALRALKALVKLQALVRGHILRKQAADDLRRLQALQALLRARANRLQVADSHSPQPTTKKSSYSHQYGPPTPEKCEHVLRSRTMKHHQPSPIKNHGSKSFADERNEKILEMDSTKPHIMQQPRRRNLFQPDHISYSHSQSLTTSRGSSIQPPALSPSESCEVNSLTTPFKCLTHDIDEETSFCTAQNSPPFYALSFKGNSSMRVGPFTPAKSDSSRSCLSGYSDHPNYMAYTESSRAKVRSLSAPRQRPQLEFPKRYSMYGYGSGAQRSSNLRDSFMNKAYPGSGRLDRLGMPVGGMGVRETEFSGSYWN